MSHEPAQLAEVPAAQGFVRCVACGRAIECCAFCDEDDCGTATCDRCIRIELREALPVPHLHGG
ncbi:MAG TPA: hypothetical protein VGB19_08510 [Actinomycetota bacterium]